MASMPVQIVGSSTEVRDFGKHKDGDQIREIERRSQSSTSSEAQKSRERPRDPFSHEDDVSVSEGEIKFRTLKWWQCGVLMIAETISLGILSLPSVLATVGLIPGLLILLGMGLLATYSGYTIGQFKQCYPGVHNMADAFEILCKPLGFPNVGKEIGGAAQTIFLIFSMASHVLTWIICFNSLTDHAICNIAWGVAALFVFWLFDLPRTLKDVSYISIASFASILTAVLIAMIAVGVQNTGKGAATYTLWPDHPIVFYKAFLSVTNIVFAYAGHVAFFTFISELEDPREFPKALALLQVCDITMYTIAAVVIYRFAGEGVTSPALGAAGPVIGKVAYGVSIPTIIIAGVIYGHVASKYVFIRLCGVREMAQKTPKAYIAWGAITFTLWAIAWIIAESIPDFNYLLGVISSLFASWFTYGVSGVFWLFINSGKWFSTRSKTFLTFVNFFLVFIGAAICGIGLYASGYAIHVSEGKDYAWSCGNRIYS